ncbi:MAG TPA: hypothetical protein VGH27_09165 [Streptosporangiaceae bacterium]|jgi:hypothetical protein
MTGVELQAKLVESLNSPRENLISALQQWFELVDKAEDQFHRAFQLRWGKCGIQVDPYTEEFTIPWEAFVSQIFQKILAANIIRGDTIPQAFTHNAREYFYVLRNIVFLLNSGFNLFDATKGIQPKLGTQILNLLYLGNSEVYTSPFYQVSNDFPEANTFCVPDKSAINIERGRVYLTRTFFFSGCEFCLLDLGASPIEIHYIYNKTKKADPELINLGIPLSGNPGFENLADNKIFTNLLITKAGINRPNSIALLPDTMLTNLPESLASKLGVRDDPSVHLLSEVPPLNVIEQVLKYFKERHIVVKPSLGTKGWRIEFFENTASSSASLGNRQSAAIAIRTILQGGDGAVIEERIFAPDHGKSVIRALGVSTNLQLLTGIDLVLNQQFDPVFLEANGNRSAGFNWLLKFGDREAVKRAVQCMLSAAQAYRRGTTINQLDLIQCGGYFVKMWTEQTDRPVNTALGAVTVPWPVWEAGHVPLKRQSQVRQAIERLTIQAFTVLQEAVTT